MLAQHYISVGPIFVLSGVSDAGMLKRHQHNAPVRKHSTITQCGFNDGTASNTASTLKQHWLYATCLRKVYNRPGNILVLGKRHSQLTDIEPAMGCNAGPTLNRSLVGSPTSSVRAWRHLLSPWYDVHRRQVLN